MAKVRILFPDGSEADAEGFDQLNLLAHGQLAEREMRSRCGGQCECGTCRVTLVAGELSPMRPAEKELLARVGAALDGKTRLACQAFPVFPPDGGGGAVVVAVPAERFQDARFHRKTE